MYNHTRIEEQKQSQDKYRGTETERNRERERDKYITKRVKIIIKIYITTTNISRETQIKSTIIPDEI